MAFRIMGEHAMANFGFVEFGVAGGLLAASLSDKSVVSALIGGVNDYTHTMCGLETEYSITNQELFQMNEFVLSLALLQISKVR